MKKIVSIIITLIMCLTLIGSVGARPVKQMRYSADALEDASVLLFIPAGDNNDSIGYIEGEEGHLGPEAFVVNDRGVYLLDSVKNRIIAREGNNIRYIEVNKIDHPEHFAIIENCFYIVGENSIYSIDVNGNEQTELSLPCNVSAFDIYRFYENKGVLYLLTHDLACFEADLSTGKWTEVYDINVAGKFEQTETLSFLEKKVDFNVGTTSLVQYIQHNDSEIIVGVYEFVPYYPVIETEYTVRKYNLRGELKGCTVLNNLEAYSIPNTVAYVDSVSEDVYTMICREEGVYITKPNFRMDYQSHMDELTEIAERIISETEKTNPMRYSTVTSQKRSQVKARAEAAKNHAWTVTSRNKQGGTHITVPDYVSSAPTNSTVYGIPYCWDGYFEDFHTDDNDGFDDIISNSTGGNTYHYIGHNQVPGTAGLDCSGFVSYAYKISRHNTEDFTSYGHYVYGSMDLSTIPACTSFQKLKYMDFLVRYSSATGTTNNHIILCYQKTDDTNLVSIESTTIPAYNNDTMQGVKTRSLSISNLSNYRLRTPYACGGNAACVWGSQYYHNSTKHWQKCIHCGESAPKSNHTMSAYQYNTYFHWKTCTTCGYSSPTETHNWVQVTTGYQCSNCGAFTHHIPLPDKVPDNIEIE